MPSYVMCCVLAKGFQHPHVLPSSRATKPLHAHKLVLGSPGSYLPPAELSGNPCLPLINYSQQLIFHALISRIFIEEAPSRLAPKSPQTTQGATTGHCLLARGENAHEPYLPVSRLKTRNRNSSPTLSVVGNMPSLLCLRHLLHIALLSSRDPFVGTNYSIFNIISVVLSVIPR
ncbi:hypothetical protein BDW60DRAFT_58979 [Aspergillus nidulans var. acristatus]